MPSIPSPLPVTCFPSLTTLLDAPDASSRPSSYREQRAVRCRSLPRAASSAEPDSIARKYAAFVLSLTGEDEAVFTLHLPRADCRVDEADGGPDETATTQRAVYATKQDLPDGADDPATSQRYTATVIDHSEGYVTTDFALVLGHAPSEALKV